MHSGLTISHADPRPMYLQIVEQVRRRIAVGDWSPGHEIPSIRALAAATQVSVMTIKRAFLELEHEGLIVTRQGRGTFVADDAAVPRDLAEQELARHLARAVELGRELRLTAQQLTERVRDAARAGGLSTPRDDS